MIFIVRLFSEITIKSPPVRKRWTKLLTENLRTLSRRLHEQTSVRSDWDRIEIKVRGGTAEALKDSFIDMLSCTPGIANFSCVQPHKFESLHDIYCHTYALWQSELAGKTFCVRVRRSGTHDFTSTEVERYVGGGLHQNIATAGVKLKDPDVVVKIEIKDDLCYIVERQFSGLGGFPLGTQDHVLSLVSGGFDSTVASYLMIKRGMRTHYCFFNLGGREHELGVKEIAYYLWSRYGSTHRVRFISVPFERVVEEILLKIDASNMGVVLKRMMFRVAEKVAAKGGVSAIVTGEAVAQVSSQTIPNLSAIDSVTDTIVLRPLIVMDKPDIIKLSREIGAEAFSANIPEYCGVISVKPSSKVNVQRLEEQEAKFDFSVLEQAIENCSVQAIDEVMQDVNEGESHSVSIVERLPAGATVIDVRHPDEQELRPLQVVSNEVIHIPFYSLSSRAKELDTGSVYMLYCERGVMSSLHAAHLQDEGFTNVGVYRPVKK